MPIAGVWGQVNPWPIVAISVSLTPDGKVLSHGTDTLGQQGGQMYYDVWDPLTNIHKTLIHGTHTDLFCSATIINPLTGDILITGGDTRGLGDGVINNGVPDTNIYDWRTEELTPSPWGPMNW